ncbi:MAG: DUF2065 domain-containing protein [Aestuariivita sp.]|nr:DUF2065 domain-containing protein [Aestuariivita sp.]
MSVLGVTFLAVGLVLIVEGLAYVLAPAMIERILLVLSELPEAVRRQVGLLAVVMGMICVWIAFQFGS